MMSITVNPWMRDELARRKQLWRDLFAGKPLERVPVDVRVCVPSPVPATVQEQFRDGDKQLAAALANALASWEHAPSSDGIPAMRPDIGCSCLASAFGAEYHWSENPNQTPGILSRILTLDGLSDQVAALAIPDPARDGWVPEGLKRIRLFAEAGEGFIPSADGVGVGVGGPESAGAARWN